MANTTKRSTTIELNGNTYDARTGELLRSVNAKSRPRSTAVASPKFVDGFIKPPHRTTVAGTALKAVTSSAPTHISKTQNVTQKSPKKPVMDIARPAPKHVKHHAPKKSQTLMRSAVVKPQASLKRKAKPVSNTAQLVAQPKPQIVPKLAHPIVDPKREARAKQVHRSEQIRRYALDTALRTPRPTIATTSRPRPAQHHVAPVYADTAAAHAVQAPLANANSMDIFERALMHANSHKEPLAPAPGKRTRTRPRGAGKKALSISTATLAILLLVGFIGFQNQAQISIKYAAGKAGFSAQLPSYRPAGYKLGKLDYNTGMVAVNYTNPSSGQSFKLVQQESKWDSSALLDDFVSTNNDSYKTVQAAGRTIYTYGKNNATWVVNGVWYQLQADGNLTTNELVNLATSI